MAKKKEDYLKTIKSLFGELEERYAFFGLGVNAFNRLGPEYFIPNYKLLSLRYPLDNRAIEKDLEIFSLERDKKDHINAPRNSNTLIKHPETQKHLEQFEDKQIIFLVYKPFLSMQKIAKENGWLLCANPYKFGKKLFENKILFRKILKKLDLPVAPGEILKDPELLVKDYEKYEKKYSLPLVVQHPAMGGGRGTFFVNSKQEMKGIMQYLEGETLVLKFITGTSPSITGCVTPWGVAYTYPQEQILDQEACHNLEAKQGNGLWCGHDWTYSKYDDKTLKDIYKAVSEVGKYLASKKYRGIFGLDFIRDEATGQVYVGECNPRLLGSFPAINMVQFINGEVPILALHMLSFLELEPRQHDIMRRIFDEIVEQMKTPKRGSQLVLHNKQAKWSRATKEIIPGVYKITKDNKLYYVREGYSLSHIKRPGEFVLSDGLRKARAPLSPNRRIMRLLSLEKILADGKHLTPWATKASQLSHDALGIKPVRFFKLKRFFNPRYLAKG